MGNQLTVQDHLTWLRYNVLLCGRNSFFGVASAKNGIEWRQQHSAFARVERDENDKISGDTPSSLILSNFRHSWHKLEKNLQNSLK